MAMLAIAVGMVSLALRDRSSQKLEEEGARLAALLESARAHSRALGYGLSWRPAAEAPGFEFLGSPPSLSWPKRWLDDGTRARILGGADRLSLGPEPMVGEQRVVLSLGEQEVVVATDGWAPFAVNPVPAAGASQP